MPTPAPAPPPYRQLSRLATELHVTGIRLVNDLFPGRYADGVLFLLAARVCAPDWIGPTGLEPPRQPTRTLTVTAMADALFRPFETTRRQVQRLIRDGVLQRAGAGVYLAPGEAERVTAYYRAIHDSLVRLIEDIAATCDLAFPAPVDGPVPTDAILTRALDIHLLPFDESHAPTADWSQMALWGTLSALNIRHVTYDPVLGRRFAHESTPDAHRRPVSIRAVAAALRMPYATAWRHFAALAAAGLCTRVPDGWVVLTRNLRSDRMEPRVLANMDYILRRIRELALAGFDVAAADRHYLGPRPPRFTQIG